MTRYSPVIGWLLAWQLLMPVLCFFTSVTWWIAAATACVFGGLLMTKNWEKNTYSIYSAVATVAMSIALASILLVSPCHAAVSIAAMLWIYAMVACTATSPYPLAIRMPVIVYTLAYIYMLPTDSPAWMVATLALSFSAIMCWIALRWRVTTCVMTIVRGPKEPPYSFSLATAIVAAVAINLCLTIAKCMTASRVPNIISIILLSALCIWLLTAKDWQKNLLAVVALLLMVTLHALTAIGYATDSRAVATATFVLAVSPVMFHTTAPVFRGMRIVITLFAVYTALNRPGLCEILSASPLRPWQHAIIIGIDAAIAATLLAMARHWYVNNS